MSDKKDLKFRSECPLATTLDVLGDKWTLLVIRDLAYGRTTFSELEQSMESITTNILADRLKRLESVELLEKVLYQERPKRYRYTLTERGKSLLPILSKLASWGEKYLGDFNHSMRTDVVAAAVKQR